MTSVPAVELAKGVAVALHNATGKTFERSYDVNPEPGEVVSGKWFVMAATEDFTKRQRVDVSKLAVDVGYFRALPESSDEYPNPEKNLPWLDSQMEEVESVKALFREDGALSELVVANCCFVGMINSPLYNPDALGDGQVFISVVRLEFTYES